MSNRITVDELTESQMALIRGYLGKLPNKPHEVRNGVGSFSYRRGDYVEVTVGKVNVPIDKHTAKASAPSYHEVIFSVPYTKVNFNSLERERVDLNEAQLKERQRVVKGLVSLLGEFLTKK